MTSGNISKKKGEPLSSEAFFAQQKQEIEATIRLLEMWLADESGCDDKVNPVIKQAIKYKRLALRFFDN
jgi:hypothetical protein